MIRYRLLPFIILSTIFVLPVTAAASEFECSIKSVLRLNETGSIVRHGWEPNYLDRQFTVDRESGRVLRTTALKQRLNNFNKESIPHVLDYGDKNDAYKAITLFEESGGYAVLQIDNVGKGSDMPFFYQTNIGMILTGLCSDAK